MKSALTSAIRNLRKGKRNLSNQKFKKRKGEISQIINLTRTKNKVILLEFKLIIQVINAFL